MSMGTISYILPLFELGRGFTPKKILELGCGCSSFVMRWMWEKAEMIIIDDHERWLECTKNMGDYKQQTRLLIKTKEETIKAIENNAPYDFVFIDSGHTGGSDIWRADFLSLIKEKKLLNPKGKILLHDADREEYQKAIDKWEKIETFIKYRSCIISNE